MGFDTSFFLQALGRSAGGGVWRGTSGGDGDDGLLVVGG
jgi:hypothetical protein